jgi:hypothetical protein
LLSCWMYRHDVIPPPDGLQQHQGDTTHNQQL